jgi:membrane protease YdiL (CAAX protease family)
VEIVLSSLIVIFLLGGVTIIANLAEGERRWRVPLFVAIIGINGLLLLYVLLALIAAPLEEASAEAVEQPTSELTAFEIIASVVITLSGIGICSLLLLRPVREWAARFFPRASLTLQNSWIPNPIRGGEIEGASVSGASPSSVSHQGFIRAVQNDLGEAKFVQQLPDSSGFRPESMVHMWALIVMIQFVTFQLMSFFLLGGLGGVAEEIAADYVSLIANFMILLILPLLGIGLGIRRDLRQGLLRLGIYPLTSQDWVRTVGVSAGATVALVIAVMIMAGIWEASVSPETFKEQTEASDALANSVTSIGLALMVAITTGIGEELAFRGALQPIFGFWFTAVMFVISHSQYTLTPAYLIILVVAIGLGLIRKYYDTTTAILTHFLYNLTLLLISLASQGSDTESWIHFLH